MTRRPKKALGRAPRRTPRRAPRLAQAPARRWQAPYPLEVKEEALRLMRRTRTPVEEIAERLGLRVFTLRTWASEQQISLRLRQGPADVPVYARYRYRQQEICELLLSNLVSVDEVAARYGVSAGCVRVTAATFGVNSLRKSMERRASR